MKSIKCLVLTISAILLISSFTSCKSDGDLGKQTTVDTENGYTLVQEVKNYKLSDDEKIWKKLSDLQTDNFVTDEKNKEGNIKTKSDALSIAKKEIKEKYNSIRMYYDRTRGVWKITFSNDSVSEDEKGFKVITTHIIDTVYVDEDGYTLALYHGEITE